MNHSPRVVLDTNLLISCLIFGGRLGQLRTAWKGTQFLPLISKATTLELIRVLSYPKFQLSEDEQQDLLSDYLPYCETVAIPEAPPQTPTCRDPFDIPFLILAMVGQADFLVTGDRDLLSVEWTHDCSILHADAFMDLLELHGN